MTDRLKVLDCNRKALLGLPSAALHLWLVYYMNEDEEQESYLSLDEIEVQLNARMSRRTIITWTKWLVKHGWLADTGRVAADKFTQQGRTVSRGAYQVKVYRCDDPVKLTSAKSAPVQFAHKVSGSGSGSGFDSRSSSDSATETESESESVRHGGKVQNENQNPEPKPQPKPTPTPTPTPTAKPIKGKVACDGTPWPESFDSWTNVRRTNWLKLHDGSGESKRELDQAARQMELSRKAGQALLRSMAVSSSQTVPLSEAPKQPRQGRWSLSPMLRLRRDFYTTSYVRTSTAMRL